MEIKAIQDKITDYIKKYRYVALVILIGIVIMLIPTGKKEEAAIKNVPTVEIESETSIDEALADILSQINGAGKVQVLLTVASGEETIYQTDDSMTASDSTNTTQRNTITVTDAQRNQTGLIRQVNPPTYLGAIVVCEGADSPAVQLAIINAVSKVTGLGADRISVLKMK